MKRKHRSVAERAAAVAAWQASGETAEVWAAGAGIAPSTLSRWRSEASGGRVGFVQVARGAVVASDEAGLSREWTVEAGDVRVRLSRGTAWADVTRLVAALRSAP